MEVSLINLERPWQSGTYFLEVSALVSLKVVINNSLREKRTIKFRFLGHFSIAKTEECDQKDQNCSDEFTMLMEVLDTYFVRVDAMAWSGEYFLETSAHVLLKFAFKDYFRDKATMEI